MITVVAKEKGIEVGRGDFSFPENVSEAVDMFGDAKVFDTFIKAFTIECRAGLYTKKAATGGKVLKAVYEKLIASGIDAGLAAQVTGYKG